MPRAVDDVVGLDVTCAGPHTHRAAALDDEVGDRDPLDDPGATEPGAPGQRHRDVGGGGPPLVGVVQRARQAVGIQQGEELERLVGAEHLHPDAAAARGGRLPQQLLTPGLAHRDVQRAGRHVARGEPGLLLEAAVDLQAALDDLPRSRGGARRGDQAGGVPGRARRQGVLLEQQHVADPSAGQVVGDAASDDATADHHDLGTLRQGFGHQVSPPWVPTGRGGLRAGGARRWPSTPAGGRLPPASTRRGLRVVPAAP